MSNKGGKPTILILVEWFSPGYRAGGPIRSVVNLVEGLKDHFDFKVITTNRDLGSEPYEGIPSELKNNAWLEFNTTYNQRSVDNRALHHRLRKRP